MISDSKDERTREASRKIYLLEPDVKFVPEERCLLSDNGEYVELSESSYRFLLLLLNGVTGKQEIIEKVWSEQSGNVSDNSYYSQIHTLRKGLDLVGLPPSLIKTIPRKGVKYIGKYKVEESQNDSSQKNGNLYLSLSTAYSPEKENLRKSITSFRRRWHNARRWDRVVMLLVTLACLWLLTLSIGVIYLLSL